MKTFAGIAAVALATALLGVQPTSYAAEGLPGATVRADAGKGAAGRRARAEERCRAEPEKCREAQARMQERRELCRAQPEKCRAEGAARREEWCKANPERCKEMQARPEQCKANPEQCRAEREARFEERFRGADANGDGAISRAEAEQGMPGLARRFDAIDANRDGVVTREELAAARKARAGARKDRDS